MINLEKEKFFKCPFCFEKISMLLDLSEDGLQTYVEDCEVCCNPIQIEFEVVEHKLTSFAGQKAFGS